MPTLAVHIVMWNGSEHIDRLLNSLSSQTYPLKRIRIHDNNSSDNTVALLQKWQLRIKFDFSKSSNNLGFSGGHNLLYHKADEDYILILNQDIELAPTYISSIIESIEKNEKIGSASGVLFRLSSDDIDTAGLKIHRTHHVKDIHTLPTMEIVEVFGVAGAAAIYRRQALERVAYSTEQGKLIFSDKFHTYKEDIDLAYRLQLAGWRSVVIKKAIAKHERGVKNNGYLNRSRQKAILLYYSYRNHLLFLRHTAHFSWLSTIGLNVVIYELAKLVWIIFKEPYSLRAYRDIWKLKQDIQNKKLQVLKMTTDSEAIKKWYV